MNQTLLQLRDLYILLLEVSVNKKAILEMLNQDLISEKQGTEYMQSLEHEENTYNTKKLELLQQLH